MATELGSLGIAKFKMSPQGFRDVLRSESVRADMGRRAQNVARAARGRMPTGNKGTGVRLIADTHSGRNRAGATVIGIPMWMEKRYRVLGASIDAARS